jgi:NAD(P)-dependent dehydrogenase (short-subunit alcohol dehydrogenase family)
VLEQPAKMIAALSAPAAAAPSPSPLIPLIGSTSGPTSPPTSRGPEEGVVLVTGATGGVGRRVVAELLRRGRRVRALVRDVPKARQALGALPAGVGAALDLAPADLAQPATLLPEMFDGVRQVVWCASATVAPKEGDTADRQKYRQGIKFYDPEIQGDAPEAVEAGGMRRVLALAGRGLGAAGAPAAVYLPDGSAPATQWGPLDDVVMGGASVSGLEARAGASEGGAAPAGVFSGRVTSANNGGFASVRTRNLDPPLDLGAYAGLELRLKGDGQRYKLILRMEPAWDGVGYTASFDTRPGEWQTVRLPFAAFVPVFRAKTVAGAPRFDPRRLTSVQLMLSKFEYDGRLNPAFREGAFELPLQRVSAYLDDPQVSIGRFAAVSPDFRSVSRLLPPSFPPSPPHLPHAACSLSPPPPPAPSASSRSAPAS